MKEYIEWLLDPTNTTLWAILTLIGAVLLIFELSVLFVVWDVSWTALRFIILMSIILAIPYAAYRLEKRNERD